MLTPPHLQITEERRRIPAIVREKALSSTSPDPGYLISEQGGLASEQGYLDKFVRNIQDDLEGMLRESREIDNLLLSRTNSINR